MKTLMRLKLLGLLVISKHLGVGEDSTYSIVKCAFLCFLYNYNFMKIIFPNVSYSSQNSQSIDKNIITQDATTLTAKADT